ncbi:MAG: hypothetical protein O9282_12255 [Flavobacterium sp.]|uniref:DUF6933 domain-containing protein n=1 Tax=Flavobacterium sp. TaxID=239 RepID=UPI0022BAFA43|nr:hypothetical protein [Flavobacterium sp.]MCZ8332075.1 hypothetical protein [Flavobacterium sp.]
MKIYCSKKLEVFLGKRIITESINENSIYGDWNGHLFTVKRKKCLLFMNNRTCYSLLFVNVNKKSLKDFGFHFKERLISQLSNDLNISESIEVKLRKDFNNIEIVNTNNDKKIIGTINHHIENLKYYYYDGNIENWDEFKMTKELNDYLVGTKLFTELRRNRDFIRPIELMAELLK